VEDLKPDVQSTVWSLKVSFSTLLSISAPSGPVTRTPLPSSGRSVDCERSPEKTAVSMPPMPSMVSLPPRPWNWLSALFPVITSFPEPPTAFSIMTPLAIVNPP